MNHLFFISSRPMGRLLVLLLSWLPVLLPGTTLAHPMPTSVVLLRVHADRLDARVQIPLSELQAAIGQAVNDSLPSGFVGTLAVEKTQNPINELYRELTAQLHLLLPPGTMSGNLCFSMM